MRFIHTLLLGVTLPALGLLAADGVAAQELTAEQNRALLNIRSEIREAIKRLPPHSAGKAAVSIQLCPTGNSKIISIRSESPQLAQFLRQHLTGAKLPKLPRAFTECTRFGMILDLD